MKRFFYLVVFMVATVGTMQNSYAALIDYTAILNGPSESPPNASPGTGTAFVEIDTVANTLKVDVTFTGLTGTTTAAHIHAPTPSPATGTAGVATQTPTFTGFPLGVTSGSYASPTFDMTLVSTYNPAFVTAHGGTAAGAEAALVTSLAAGEAYFNIHTNQFPGGEIRGFLQPQSVPEPATMLFLCLGIAGVVGLKQRFNS